MGKQDDGSGMGMEAEEEKLETVVAGVGRDDCWSRRPRRTEASCGRQTVIAGPSPLGQKAQPPPSAFAQAVA